MNCFSFSFPHSPSPGSTDPTTSPSNCQNSPQGGSGSDYNGGGRERSPDNSAQIDIRAQFLADLRRLGDRRGATSPDLAPPRQDNLPPRKRKVSHEHEAGETGNGNVGTGSKISLTDRSGLNSIASDSAVVNWVQQGREKTQTSRERAHCDLTLRRFWNMKSYKHYKTIFVSFCKR